jgi:hypothetical protein
VIPFPAALSLVLCRCLPVILRWASDAVGIEIRTHPTCEYQIDVTRWLHPI